MSKAKLEKKSAKAAVGQQAKPEFQTSWSHTLRETVESVVIAFILAFLFRTFEAEAFVIPTGSMAPTLQGRHKDIVCPKCGYEYRTGASEEVDRVTNALLPQCSMRQATCPMCRYTIENIDSAANKAEYPSYSGDRIIVSKFAYDLSPPRRWEVVVFKYPEDAKQNYIKRLVGLPGEHIKIQHGDVYAAPDGSNDLKIARKGNTPPKVQAMLQPVYDNDCAVDALLDAGFPARWQAWSSGASPSKTDDKSRSFKTDGKTSERAWLRYQHIVPDMTTWNAVAAARQVRVPPPELITDYYAYNKGNFPAGCEPGGPEKRNWVGDLALDFELTVANQTGHVILELVKGGRQFHCTIDLATGQATLAIVGLADYAPTAQTAIRGPGTYKLSFANVDEQLLLWVDGDVVSFNTPTTYPSLDNYKELTAQPTPGSEIATDLSPVGIAVEGGADVKVSHLNIRRDVFYTNDLHSRMTTDIVLKPDQFFMLGDNSPKSADGRYWQNTNYVDRSLLIGKALFIYWPHSFDEIEIGNWKIPFPFFPNFGDMGFVQ